MLTNRSFPATLSMILAVAILNLYCNDKSTDVDPYVQGPESDMKAFFPLHKDNQWAYVDSMGSDLTHIELITVRGYLYRGGKGWWEVRIASSGRFYYQLRNDSVIVEHPDWPSASLTYIPPDEYGLPRVFRRPYPVSAFESIEVVQTNARVTVPAGTFDSLVVLTSTVTDSPLRQVTYFKRGLGPIRSETYNANGLWSSRSLLFAVTNK